MIQAVGLKKHYGSFSALHDVTFQVGAEEVVGFLGPNGAGKTTSMRILTTFLPPSGGSAMVAGYDVVKQPAEVRRRIGYLPETPPLYPELSVREYLRFVGKIKGLRGAELRSHFDETVEVCGLSAVTGRVCGQLSKGYKQRVGLAQAIIHRPEVIILDEPTSGLDPQQILEIRKLIRDLKKRHTVLISTHILPEVVETCSRVVIIANGRTTLEGSIADLTKEKTLEERFLAAVAKDSFSIHASGGEP